MSRKLHIRTDMRISNIMPNKRLRIVVRMKRPRSIILLITVTPKIAPATGNNKEHEKSTVPFPSVPQRASDPVDARFAINRVTIHRIANELDEPAEPAERERIMGHGVAAKRSTTPLTRGAYKKDEREQD